jgi:hypothetical protein
VRKVADVVGVRRGLDSLLFGKPIPDPARSPGELHHHARTSGTTGPWAAHTAGVQITQFGVASVITLHDLRTAPNGGYSTSGGKSCDRRA